MTDFQTALQMIERSDRGYLYLLLMVWLAAAIAMYLVDRRAWVRRVLGVIPGAVMASLLIVSPVTGALALLATAATRIRISFDRPLPWIVALGALLRLPGLFMSLSNDEAFTRRVLQLPLSDFWGAIMIDVHPPLYYALLKPLAALTLDPALLRLTSLIVGLWGIVLVWELVRALDLGDRVATIAALLWAVLPAAVYYSTELRSYALLTNLILAMILAILRDRPGRFGIWLICTVWLHNAGLFYAAVFGLAALGMHPTRKWLRTVLIAGAVSALWLPFLLQQAQNVAADHWAYINPGMVFWPITIMTVFNVGELAGVVIVVIAALTIVAFVRMHEFLLFTGRGLLLLTAILAVPALEVLLSLVWRPTYIWRHFLPCGLLLAVPWAWMLARSRLAQLAVVPALTAALIGLYTYGQPQARPDYRGWLADGCQGAPAAYATSINAAYIMGENSALPLTLWPGAWDNSRTVRIEDVDKLGYETGPLPPGACILQVDTPGSQQAERDFLTALEAEQIAEYHLGEFRAYYLLRIKSPG